MKTIDRIFIGAILLIICISGLYTFRSVLEHRAREAINVVGEGKVTLPADKVVIHINAIFWGDTKTLQQQAFDDYLSGLQTEYSSQGFNIENKNFHFIEQGGCYIDGNITLMDKPCLDAYFMIIGQGTDLLEKTKQLITSLEKNWSTEINTIQFSINETGEALHQARIAALQDGKTIAQHTADQLGVQLGRLLQTTEYPLASDYYGPQQEQYSVHFYRGDDIAQFKGVDIIRKVYLTYDID